MDEEMKAKHAGFTKKRAWHKVKWIKGKFEGKFELFTDEDLGENKNNVEVIQTFKTDMCTSGVPFGFGKNTEDKIDAWIKQNKR